jgi:hypothetical protein
MRVVLHPKILQEREEAIKFQMIQEKMGSKTTKNERIQSLQYAADSLKDYGGQVFEIQRLQAVSINERFKYGPASMRSRVPQQTHSLTTSSKGKRESILYRGVTAGDVQAMEERRKSAMLAANERSLSYPPTSSRSYSRSTSPTLSLNLTLEESRKSTYSTDRSRNLKNGQDISLTSDGGSRSLFGREEGNDMEGAWDSKGQRQISATSPPSYLLKGGSSMDSSPFAVTVS